MVKYIEARNMHGTEICSRRCRGNNPIQIYVGWGHVGRDKTIQMLVDANMCMVAKNEYRCKTEHLCTIMPTWKHVSDIRCCGDLGLRRDYTAKCTI